MSKRPILLAVLEVLLLLSPTRVLAAAVKEDTTMVESEKVKVFEPWQTPLIDYRITQKFSVFHMGVDLAVPIGAEIRPALSGIVERIEKKWFGYGFNVLIKHDEKYETLYAHMSKINVKEGDAVTKQTVLGLSGSTGNSTGPHVHFELRKDEKAINPVTFLEL
jgi:murein DD-endopeptidase MepM/ murein hydrolase activator NlpD